MVKQFFGGLNHFIYNTIIIPLFYHGVLYHYIYHGVVILLKWCLYPMVILVYSHHLFSHSMYRARWIPMMPTLRYVTVKLSRWSMANGWVQGCLWYRVRSKNIDMSFISISVGMYIFLPFWRVLILYVYWWIYTIHSWVSVTSAEVVLLWQRLQRLEQTPSGGSSGVPGQQAPRHGSPASL